MSISELRNVVLLLSNPAWSRNTVPTTVIRNLTALSSQIAYEEHLTSNLTTLSSSGAETHDGTIQGLLYVPDISIVASCNAQQYDFIPRNVTHRRQLPANIEDTIAIAPWYSVDCTQAYLNAVASDNIRAFIFYKPNNSTNKPQDASSPVWNLNQGGNWQKYYNFPIYAVPGLEGQKMVTQLSLYSGIVDEVPHGDEISQLYGPNPHDFVRISTTLTVIEKSSGSTALWIYFLIVFGVLIVVVAAVSGTMHVVQRRRRASLRRRVESGEVDLEAMGIKRLTVPAAQVRNFPLYTYNADPDALNPPETPTSAVGHRSSRSGKASRKSRRTPSDIGSQRSTQTRRSMRSMRSSLAGATDATATNFQPNCHICLVAFEHRISVIREVPCGHIYHPSCIDEFLTKNSSLCPMCKQCMLPRGYSPKITYGMVRRERALRRLRERVDLDDISLESGEPKFKEWGKRLFSSSTTPAVATSDVPMTPVKHSRSTQEASDPPPSDPGEPAATVATEQDLSSDSNTPVLSNQNGNADEPPLPQSAQIAPKKKARPRRALPRALRLLPTQPENGELNLKGRGSPSSFARERMREIAAKNAPFDDPDQERIPHWRRAVSKAFPGFV